MSPKTKEAISVEVVRRAVQQHVGSILQSPWDTTTEKRVEKAIQECLDKLPTVKSINVRHVAHDSFNLDIEVSPSFSQHYVSWDGDEFWMENFRELFKNLPDQRP